MQEKNILKSIYDSLANNRGKWIEKNKYYYNQLLHLIKSHIEPQRNVIEVGCEIGYFVGSINARKSLGIDISQKMIDNARQLFPHVDFIVHDTEDVSEINEKFDYVLLINSIGDFFNVQIALKNIRKITTPKTRLIIIYYNHLWEPLIKIAEMIRLKVIHKSQNWLSPPDIENLLYRFKPIFTLTTNNDKYMNFI